MAPSLRMGIWFPVYEVKFLRGRELSYNYSNCRLPGKRMIFFTDYGLIKPAEGHNQIFEFFSLISPYLPRTIEYNFADVVHMGPTRSITYLDNSKLGDIWYNEMNSLMQLTTNLTINDMTILKQDYLIIAEYWNSHESLCWHTIAQFPVLSTDLYM